MDIKLRFTAFFSVVLVGSLGIFSALVYDQVRNRMLDMAEQTLITHLEHDAQHLDHGHHTVVHPLSSSALRDARGISVRIWKNGKLVEDSFPVKLSDDRIMRRLQTTREGDHYLVEGYIDLAQTRAYLGALRNVLSLGCLLALGFAIPFSFVSTRFLLEPFRNLAKLASQLNAEKLSFRFGEPKSLDEYGKLVRSFNRLLHRLEISFGQITRFATNASHELRTPLAVIIGQGEMALRRQREPDDYRNAIDKMLTQAKNLKGIVSRLLALAELERAGHAAPAENVEVKATLEEVTQSLAMAYRTMQKSIEVNTAPESLQYLGSRDLFLSVTSNLLENALKYSRTKVAVTATKLENGVEISVEDDGPGIPEADWETVFEPFTRSSNPSSAAKGGHGLGLSIARACVKAGHGNITLGNSPLGGLSVTVTLPSST